MADNVFLKIYVELEGNWIFQKKHKISSKLELFIICLKFNPFMYFFLKTWQCSLWFYKIPMSGKITVLQSWPKMLLANQIAVFFDHQFLWKESINILDFLHGDNY